MLFLRAHDMNLSNIYYWLAYFPLFSIIPFYSWKNEPAVTPAFSPLIFNNYLIKITPQFTSVHTPDIN